MPIKGQAPTERKPTRKLVLPPRHRLDKITVKRFRAWKLEDAKAKFSEVVRRARHEGPQRVTYRGEDAVVVIAVEELKKLLPAEQPRQSLVEFLRGTALGEIDIRREPDRGRDLVL